MDESENIIQSANEYSLLHNRPEYSSGNWVAINGSCGYEPGIPIGPFVLGGLIGLGIGLLLGD